MPDKICFASVDVEFGMGQMKEILDIFKKNKISATLFITGEFLEKYKLQAMEWIKSHEIACHSFTHRFWSALNHEERKKELDDFNNLYRDIFQKFPLGFRAPSHVIDEDALEVLEEKVFLYDSSVVPHYPPLKKYRGYKGKRAVFSHRPASGRLF